MPDITYTLLINNMPAPPEVMEGIIEIQVENRADRADAFSISIATDTSDTGDWSILDDDLFRPLTPFSIRMQVGTGLSEPLISGYVTAQQTDFHNEPGGSSVKVVGLDATVLMNLEDKIVPWPNMADSDIATAIFSSYGFMPQVDRTQPVRQEIDTTTIQRGTDIQFLRTLAEKNGFECYVEMDPVLNIDFGHFHAKQIQGKPQGVLSVSFGGSSNVNAFNVRYEMLRPVTAQASNVDVGTKSMQNGKADAISMTDLGQEGLHARISKPQGVLPGRTGAMLSGGLQTLCQAIVDRSAWAIVAEGELDTAVYEGILRANRTVNVRGAGSLYNGTYYVNRVLHTFSEDGYTQGFELIRNAIGLTGSEVFVDTGGLV